MGAPSMVRFVSGVLKENRLDSVSRIVLRLRYLPG